MDYTSLGDGVNLAARLEGLNKYYGTTILVSESIAIPAADKFVFRFLDRVAVKGKVVGVKNFEVIGPIEQVQLSAVHEAYESAFRVYLQRDFEAAMKLLEPHVEEDQPSSIIYGRCQSFLSNPPPECWSGVHQFVTK